MVGRGGARGRRRASVECRVTSVFVDDVEQTFPPKFSAVLRRNSPRMMS
jgi:hypothetical protein